MSGRRAEPFALQIVADVLGIAYDETDDGSRPGMVDGAFTLPDGRRGAVEVTIVGEQGALTIENSLREPYRFDVLEGRWQVWLDGTIELRSLRENLLVLLQSAELQGVTTIPRGWARSDRSWPEVEWARSMGVSAQRFGSMATGEAGFVHVLGNKGGGGFTPDHLDHLPPWVETTLALKHVAHRVQKLEANGADDQHLFLVVHESAMPFELLCPLAWDDFIPSNDVEFAVPAHLEGVWVTTRWAPPVWWSRTHGWRRDDFDRRIFT